MKDWHRVEELFYSTLSLAAEERATYLARECNGDGELSAEVESLLTAFEQKGAFLEESAFSLGLRIMSEDLAESLTGSTIGSYKLLRLLGKGGMGEVYLAEDTRLSRQVALKFLARRFTNDNWAKRQLIKEAQAVAMLDHPNICAVHGFEEADDHSFIVMQYIEGETLADLLYENRLDAKQVLPLALQMVGALAEAHAHGIIHRDIKPQNLILAAGGQLKVLDFGLAKVIQKSATEAGNNLSQTSQRGLIMGTVAYMSPEQLRAKRLDFRSDVFSVGTVLYELVSGRHPFAQGSNAETISAILTSEPPPLPRSLPRGLDRVISKCLEKDKEQRYQSASELLLDLQNVQAGTAPAWPRPRLAPLMAAILLVLLAASAVLIYMRLTALPTLAIIPFANESAGAEMDYLVKGLPESLANQLSLLSKLRIKTPTIPDPNLQEADLPRIGRQLSAKTLLLGKAVAQGDVVTLQIRLVNTADARQLWVKSYDLKTTLTEVIAVDVATSLRVKLSVEEQKRLRARQPMEIEAFHEYLRGRSRLNRAAGKKDVEAAIAFFTHAHELDPAYAQAHVGLADAYLMLASPFYGSKPTPEAMKTAFAEVKKALDIDETLAEAHTTLGVIRMKYDRNWQEAEAEFKRAIQLNPNYPRAHYWYSHLLLINGREGDSIAESEIARDLDPLSSSMNVNRCRAQYWTRQYISAGECFDEMLATYPASRDGRLIRGLVYQEQGDYDKAIELFQQVYKEASESAVAALGYAYGRTGRREEAEKLLQKLEERAKAEYVPPQEFAIIYTGLGNKDEAFKRLEDAYKDRFENLIYLKVEPVFYSLRDDPRFTDLARRLNLP